jgi:guanylate kinase
MYNIIALMGESGSGKDTVLKETLIQYPDLHKIITSTSRPKREKEINGVNYFYYSDEEFFKKIYNNEMIDYQIFNNWHYGTELKALDENKPAEEIKQISEDLQQKMFSISQQAYEQVQKEEAQASSEGSEAQQNSSDNNNDDDVIDAEYTKE